MWRCRARAWSRLRESARVRGWMRAPEQAFIHVNIAQPAEEGLVQQQRLDGPLFPLQDTEKGLCGYFQGVRTQVIEGMGRQILSGEDPQSAEFADVPVTQLPGSGLQVHDHMGMFIGGRFPGDRQKLAGHAQMGHQQDIPVAGNEDELALAVYFPYDSPLKGLAESTCGEGQHPGRPHPDGSDFTADQLPAQAADDGFDFGKFGHRRHRLKVQGSRFKEKE